MSPVIHFDAMSSPLASVTKWNHGNCNWIHPQLATVSLTRDWWVYGTSTWALLLYGQRQQQLHQGAPNT